MVFSICQLDAPRSCVSVCVCLCVCSVTSDSLRPTDCSLPGYSVWLIHLIPVCVSVCVCVCAQSRLTPCDPMDGSPPGSSVHAVSQACTLEWLAVPYTGDLPSPPQCVSCTAGRFLPSAPPGKPILPSLVSARPSTPVTQHSPLWPSSPVPQSNTVISITSLINCTLRIPKSHICRLTSN